ncbi:MAG: hypothetical protein GY710_00765 [Desulfobacteraceae bacterium]|nr:hypothetical protein [Desulfobacteraceae bacterium]
MKYDLVFEGGGAKGAAFVGAFREFEKRNHTFRKLVGTSAGAITATLMAAGYTPSEMWDALSEKSTDGESIFSMFLAPPTIDEIPTAVLGNSVTVKVLKAFEKWLNNSSYHQSLEILEKILKGFESGSNLKAILESATHGETRDWILMIISAVELGGACSVQHFISWLENKLEAKNQCFGGVSLKGFYEMTKVDLSLCATDVTGQELLVLNHRTAPRLPVTMAVRMSMNIPFVWPPVTWEKMFGFYRERNLYKHKIVDGGVLSNFAVRLTTSAGPEIISVMKDSDISESEYTRLMNDCPTIGFMLDDNEVIPGVQPVASSGLMLFIKGIEEMIGGLQDSDGISLAGNLWKTIMEGNDNFVVSAEKDIVCHLPVKGIDTLEFNMTTDRQKAMVDEAQEATKKYFEQYPEYIVNDLYLAVGEDGKFEIGCKINGDPGKEDWFGLYESPSVGGDAYLNGNKKEAKKGKNVFCTTTDAKIGEYEVRYYAINGGSFKLVKKAGPLTQVSTP